MQYLFFPNYIWWHIQLTFLLYICQPVLVYSSFSFFSLNCVLWRIRFSLRVASSALLVTNVHSFIMMFVVWLYCRLISIILSWYEADCQYFDWTLLFVACFLSVQEIVLSAHVVSYGLYFICSFSVAAHLGDRHIYSKGSCFLSGWWLNIFLFIYSGDYCLCVPHNRYLIPSLREMQWTKSIRGHSEKPFHIICLSIFHMLWIDAFFF